MAFEDLTGQVISLTTFRRDGTPVPTTVWFARDGDDVIVGTEPEAGKVKRIRTNPEVTMERSNYRGRTKGGSIYTGTAQIVDGEDADRAHEVLSGKYGWHWRLAGGRIATYLRIAPNLH